MSLKKFFLKSKFSYKLYLYYNLLVRHKCFISRQQYSQWGEDILVNKFFHNISKGFILISVAIILTCLIILVCFTNGVGVVLT